MSHGDDVIESLREALRVSPDNLPLRCHLARSLAKLARYDDAEQEYRLALSASPGSVDLKVELAELYYQQGKNSQAIVIIEDLAKRNDVPAKACVLYARLLMHEGNVAGAVAQYKLALEIDPDAEDAELSQRLGIGFEEEEAGEVFEGRVRQGWQSGADDFDVEIERPVVRFADVGGMDSLKEEIGMKIIYPLQHPEMYEAYGKSAGGGILMFGPPGCGKTHMARATAGEINAGFISVGISDVLDMWTGNSERNLHEIFDRARSNKPCVIFFDEVDALGGRRSDMQGSSRLLINQFLSEMDGVDSNNDGVLVLAATNAPWHVDPAFRRPGRFDQVLFVPPPDIPARAAIFQILCRDKPTEKIDFPALAKKTNGFSGADIKAVIDAAVEIKLRESFRKGTPQPLTSKDFLTAVKKLKPTTKEWFSTARNYALYSNQGGAYDDVLKYLKLK